MMQECKHLNEVTQAFNTWADHMEEELGEKCTPGETVEELQKQQNAHKVSEQ